MTISFCRMQFFKKKTSLNLSILLQNLPVNFLFSSFNFTNWSSEQWARLTSKDSGSQCKEALKLPISVLHVRNHFLDCFQNLLDKWRGQCSKVKCLRPFVLGLVFPLPEQMLKFWQWFILTFLNLRIDNFIDAYLIFKFYLLFEC